MTLKPFSIRKGIKEYVKSKEFGKLPLQTKRYYREALRLVQKKERRENFQIKRDLIIGFIAGLTSAFVFAGITYGVNFITRCT